MFFNAAKAVPDQSSMTAGQLAQAVQKSAFPGRYDQNQAAASNLLSILGYTGAAGTLSAGGSFDCFFWISE